ncbi:hypothetical protein ACH3XW_25205 [Acanthocheilonema viteae]|uniref:Uncharacterized protein n=1 Tax=Acanthocheilonema viteae TaxID=6277 RepID=A0A498SRR3_ACAVI|nr:unnamed protein product [Acanthocheilonema viteae]
MIQIVSGTTLSVNNMEPTVAMLMIEWIARRRWMYRNTQQEVFEFTGVSCKQGIPTRPDNYHVINRHVMK